jgi:hypothetical protein
LNCKESFSISKNQPIFAARSSISKNSINMDIQGKIIQFLDPVTGEGRNGPWKKQEFVIELPGDFPKKLCITNWNDKADLAGLKEGDEVKVFVDVESREYNGRWYTDVKAWKLERVGAASEVPPDTTAGTPPDFTAPPPSPDDEPTDDLPF